MKGSRKITRIQLSVNEQEKPLLFGLVTTDPDYKLSLKLNRNLGLSLKNDSPIVSGEKGADETAFSSFIDLTEAPDLVFYLVSNRSGKNFLIRQLKNVDYLLLIHDADHEQSEETLSAKLRETDSITAVFNIDFGTVRDKNLKYLPL